MLTDSCKGSVGNLELAVNAFPLDTHDPIVVHALGFEPGFEGFAGIGAKFGEHLPFDHVDEDALGARGAAALHALRESFRALAGEASESVLREVARHEDSVEDLSCDYFTERALGEVVESNVASGLVPRVVEPEGYLNVGPLA